MVESRGAHGNHGRRATAFDLTAHAPSDEPSLLGRTDSTTTVFCAPAARNEVPDVPLMSTGKYFDESPIVRSEVWKQKFESLYRQVVADMEEEEADEQRRKAFSAGTASGAAAAAAASSAEPATCVAGAEPGGGGPGPPHGVTSDPSGCAGKGPRSGICASARSVSVSAAARRTPRAGGSMIPAQGRRPMSQGGRQRRPAIHIDGVWSCTAPIRHSLPSTAAADWRKGVLGSDAANRPVSAGAHLECQAVRAASAPSLTRSAAHRQARREQSPRRAACTKATALGRGERCLVAHFAPDLLGVRDEYYNGDELHMHEDILNESNPRLFPLRPGVNNTSFPVLSLTKVRSRLSRGIDGNMASGACSSSSGSCCSSFES